MHNIQWIENELWKDRYFSPDLLPERLELFRCGLSWPLIATIIDGYANEPNWTRDIPLSNTNTLFQRLKDYSAIVGGSSFVYITDPDNALSIIQWERVVDDLNYWQAQLEELQVNPAVEGGTSYLVLAFNDRESVVVFELDPEEFCISFYGTKVAKDKFTDKIKLPNP